MSRLLRVNSGEEASVSDDLFQGFKIKPQSRILRKKKAWTLDAVTKRIVSQVSQDRDNESKVLPPAMTKTAATSPSIQSSGKSSTTKRWGTFRFASKLRSGDKKKKTPKQKSATRNTATEKKKTRTSSLIFALTKLRTLPSLDGLNLKDLDPDSSAHTLPLPAGSNAEMVAASNSWIEDEFSESDSDEERESGAAKSEVSDEQSKRPLVPDLAPVFFVSGNREALQEASKRAKIMEEML